LTDLIEGEQQQET